MVESIFTFKIIFVILEKGYRSFYGQILPNLFSSESFAELKNIYIL
jgi:hypothetical protein